MESFDITSSIMLHCSSVAAADELSSDELAFGDCISVAFSGFSGRMPTSSSMTDIKASSSSRNSTSGRKFVSSAISNSIFQSSLMLEQYSVPPKPTSSLSSSSVPSSLFPARPRTIFCWSVISSLICISSAIWGLSAVSQNMTFSFMTPLMSSSMSPIRKLPPSESQAPILMNWSPTGDGF